MQQSALSSTSDDPSAVVNLPRYAVNLAQRILQLLSEGGGASFLSVQVIRIDGVLYLIAPGGKLEKLG